VPSIVYERFDVGLDVRRGASVSDANRLRRLENAYVTTGKSLQKRPGLTLIATLEAGTVGLRGALGKLNTFYSNAGAAVTHANTLFLANRVDHPTAPATQVAKVHYADAFLGFLYCAVEYTDGVVKHHYLDGTAPPLITDVNCPHGKGVTKIASKIWSTKGTTPYDTVRFCKTSTPRDWTAASDAGFLAVGLQQEGAQNAYALGQFQNYLVVYFNDSAQVWNVDPNPALCSLKQRIFGVGTRYPRGAASFASDNFFLADVGVRSITLNQVTDNLQDTDVGTPVDTLLRPSIGSYEPVSIYLSAQGQYWLVLGATVWVYSFSRSSKISAWSKYSFPFTIDDVTQLDNVTYMRTGNSVYKLDPTKFLDNATRINVSLELPFLDAKKPGILKQFIGADAVLAGNPLLILGVNPNDPTQVNEPMPVNGDTRAGNLTPVEVCAVSISPRLYHSADEDFRLDLLQFHFEPLGTQ